MKKIPFIMAAAVVVIILFSAVWYFSPTIFLNKVEPSDVTYISVFDGTTGKGFNIHDIEEIRYIVENIQGIKMEKDKISIGYLGYYFRMRFYDETGKEIEHFIINSAETIRKDPFFYRCDGSLCVDYLNALEDKYSN